MKTKSSLLFLSWTLDLGAGVVEKNKVRFKVWAPRCSAVDVKIFGNGNPRVCPLAPAADHYFSAVVDNVRPGTRYVYVLDGTKERPDPVSRFQPEGVHGPSEIVDPDDFSWQDRRWQGRGLAEMVFYEIHTGTFTPEGTFRAAVAKIPHLKKLGITCLEIMPVGQFPGRRNWGYDGTGLYAVQHSYGGPRGLKELVNACHRHGLAVCLDVVYNHWGPEGNYLHDYGPYFTQKYHTPWGDAVNYDGAESDAVRHFIISNALYWISEYHIDALRLDAIHSIYDFSAKHILQELKEKTDAAAQRLGRKILLIAESDLNDSRIVRPVRQGGYALDGQWSDDFHHSLHALLTKEKHGYYQDFGRAEDLAGALRNNFVYDGKYSAFRKRRHGNRAADLAPDRFVICTQNHDQTGNRALGERLGTLISFEAQKAAAVLLLAAPQIPLLFMGQEYGAKSPFQYFVDHGDPGLLRAVREGRKKEFASSGRQEIPDPGAEKTFLDSRLDWSQADLTEGKILLRLYRDLLALRRKLLPAGRRLKAGVRTRVWFDEEKKWLAASFRPRQIRPYGIVLSLAQTPQKIRLPREFRNARCLLHTSAKCYGGTGAGVKKPGTPELTIEPISASILNLSSR